MRMTKLHPCYYSAARSFFVRPLGFAVAALLLLSSPPARADVTWNVPSGDWSGAGNWSGTVVGGLRLASYGLCSSSLALAKSWLALSNWPFCL